MRLERVPIRFLAERIFLICQIVDIYSSRRLHFDHSCVVLNCMTSMKTDYMNY